MVNCLDVHSFILSLPALWLMLQFDSVLELTPFLKFSIKPLTTSNERPMQGRLARIGQDVKHHGQFKLIKLTWVLLKCIYNKVKFNQV